MIPEPDAVEVHLRPDTRFTRYGRRVKAMGGRYSACRGLCNARYVTIPLGAEGSRELIATLVRRFGVRPTTVIIARGGTTFALPAPIVVHRVDPLAADPVEVMLAGYRERLTQFLASQGASTP